MRSHILVLGLIVFVLSALVVPQDAISAAAREQDSWSYCSKCRGLWYSGGTTTGRCPAGGSHSSQGSYRYSLPTSPAPTGQKDWKRCGKCLGLWWSGGGGACPLGGAHSSDGSLEYFPNSIDQGFKGGAQSQSGWRFCVQCQGLWWGDDKLSGGACPRGGPHKARLSDADAGSYNYVLNFGGAPQPSGKGVRYRVEILIYNQPDVYANPRNFHDFLVDFAACKVTSLTTPTQPITVHVCRPNRRLTFTVEPHDRAAAVDLDWVFRDNAKVVGGAWRQGSGWGPCVGGVVDAITEWSVR
jgi:hypothetical protein